MSPNLSIYREKSIREKQQVKLQDKENNTRNVYLFKLSSTIMFNERQYTKYPGAMSP